MKKHLKEQGFVYLILLVVAAVIAREMNTNKKPTEQITFQEKQPDYWVAPSLFSDNVTTGNQRKLIIYGEDLIANTSKYLGP
jgi:thiosulfate dehydrogenase